MKRIIRELFDEREKIQEGKTVDFFSSDNISKVIRLMITYSIDEELGFQGKIKSIPIFLDRLSYYLSEGKIQNFYELNQLHNYLFNSKLNEFLSTIELFIQTTKEICDNNLNHNYLYLNNFISEFNNLLAIKTIPFRIEVFKEKIFINRINSPKEEENKKEVYRIIDSPAFSEVSEYFTTSLIDSAKRNYPKSIEEAYLALEKYLKIKINNHKFDALKSYGEFKKLFYVERGIFKIHNDQIRNMINLVYNIRSDIKSHSDKKTFERDDFLEETSKFQLNEVMTLIILLDSFKQR